jgi:hypothetical protein
MKEVKSASGLSDGQPTRRPKEKCSCGNGGEREGTHESHPNDGGCSCCCGANETTDSVLTGAMDR